MTDAVRDFVNTMINSAEDIAIFETGKPEEETLLRLKNLSERLRRQLTPIVGTDLSSRTVEAFCGAVMGTKREREALGAMNLL
ncbi:hypothetical protein [Bradyrhizobium sp. Gha]|uniref:hypothetical protein n=1 Tax=Bradyrhizobium sp. Gha TaxID=1855318 RepID=UPI0008EE599F|nr:hypothetical protein [Bradyrhizobium sp. Gha]SFI62375.1 hypothetical protein SAMN05216525_11184 [Bradyrhizobium sp. Gha]